MPGVHMQARRGEKIRTTRFLHQSQSPSTAVATPNWTVFQYGTLCGWTRGDRMAAVNHRLALRPTPSSDRCITVRSSQRVQPVNSGAGASTSESVSMTEILLLPVASVVAASDCPPRRGRFIWQGRGQASRFPFHGVLEMPLLSPNEVFENACRGSPRAKSSRKTAVWGNRSTPVTSPVSRGTPSH